MTQVVTGFSKQANGGARVLSDQRQDTTLDALRRKIEALEEANAALREKASKSAVLRLKVSEKGAVSLYGLNVRFPVTLYGAQWLKLLAYADTMREFIEANRGNLSWKE